MTTGALAPVRRRGTKWKINIDEDKYRLNDSAKKRTLVHSKGSALP